MEYRGEGYCYHSKLHPKGVEVPVDADNQPLRVEAKPREAKEPRLKDAIHTLESLPDVSDSFIRVVPEWEKHQEEERERKRKQHRHNDEDEDVDSKVPRPSAWRRSSASQSNHSTALPLTLTTAARRRSKARPNSPAMLNG